MATLFHVHDPMCSWCWGYRPAWEKLQAELPAGLEVTRLLGGLAPDTDQPMPPELQVVIQGHWRRIQALLGTEFNFDFWRDCQPRRDTYKACRAVIVATGMGAGEAMIEAIQQAYYQRALNPSDPATLVQLAGEIGLDEDHFDRQLSDPATEAELQRQLNFRRDLGVRSFPSLVMQKGGRKVGIPIDYRDHRATLRLITSFLQSA